MKRTIATIILTLAFTAFAIQAVEQKAFYTPFAQWQEMV